MPLHHRIVGTPKIGKLFVTFRFRQVDASICSAMCGKAIGAQLTLYWRLLTFDLVAVSDRHNGLAIAEMLEPMLNRARDEGWVVGGVVTNNTGQCTRARRILARLCGVPPLLCSRCQQPGEGNTLDIIPSSGDTSGGCCEFPECVVEQMTLACSASHDSATWYRARVYLTLRDAVEFHARVFASHLRVLAALAGT